MLVVVRSLVKTVMKVVELMNMKTLLCLQLMSNSLSPPLNPMKMSPVCQVNLERPN